MKDGDRQPVGLYVHWPFCTSKCPYCDFNSHVRESIPEERFLRAYLVELDHYYGRLPAARIGTIFFGGGTPSLMSAKTVEQIINHISKLWSCEPKLEITLEANPGSSDLGRFEDFRAAGINRLSLGVQSLKNDRLSWLGRAHSVGEAKTAARTARGIFDNLSLDLIYATDGQSVTEWQTELEDAISLGSDHLSLYQLTIERGTLFYRRSKAGEALDVGEELGRAFYEETQTICDKAGLPAYEISNHARSGYESLHNLNYWRGGAYIGIGPGAHGRLKVGEKWFASEQIRSPEAWVERTQKKGNGTHTEVALDRRERLEEILMMSLRLSEGIELSLPGNPSHKNLGEIIDFGALESLEEMGFLQRTGNRISASDEGRLVLNRIISELIMS